MRVQKRLLALVLALLTICSLAVTAFADGDGQYSITWVYEDHTIVDWYNEGETVFSRDATLSDGSRGEWSTNKDAESAPAVSPVPKTMPAEDLTFYAKKPFNWSNIVLPGVNNIVTNLLSKEYWQEKSPLFWVFPYVYYNLIAFFGSIFNSFFS